MGLVVADFLQQGFNQIYISNDQMPNQFFAFDSKAGTWTESAGLRGIATGPNGKSLAGMGVAAADFDRNGWLDLHVTNFSDEWANYFLQSPDGMFLDRSVSGGLAEPSGPMVGFGCQAIDLDNDRDHDLIVANGHIEDLRDHGARFKMPSQVFQFSKGRYSLVPSSELSGPKLSGPKRSGPGSTDAGSTDAGSSTAETSTYWNQMHLGRGVASGDLDNDGRVDFVITHALERARVFQNQSDQVGGFLEIEWVSTTGERSAVGSIAEVDDGKGSRKCFHQTGHGYLVRNQPIIHLGLGGHDGPY